MATPEQASSTQPSASIELPDTPIEALNDTEIPARELPSNIEESSAQLQWQAVKVRSGDSLAKIFKRNGLNATTTHKVITAQGEGSKSLKKLGVGDIIRIGKDQQGTLK